VLVLLELVVGCQLVVRVVPFLVAHYVSLPRIAGHERGSVFAPGVETTAAVSSYATADAPGGSGGEKSSGATGGDEGLGEAPTASAAQRFRAWLSKPAGLSARLGLQTSFGQKIASRLERVVDAVAPDPTGEVRKVLRAVITTLRCFFLWRQRTAQRQC
jgi:hypothetical protein